MNAAIGIGAETNAVVAVEAASAPGSECAKFQSSIVAGSAAGGGNWKNVLESLGLLPEGNTGPGLEPTAENLPAAGPNREIDNEFPLVPLAAPPRPEQPIPVKHAKHVVAGKAILGHARKRSPAVDPSPSEKHADAPISGFSGPQAAPVVPFGDEPDRMSLSPRNERRSSVGMAVAEFFRPSTAIPPDLPGPLTHTPLGTSSVCNGSPHLSGGPPDDRPVLDYAPVTDASLPEVDQKEETKPASHDAAFSLPPIENAPASRGVLNEVEIRSSRHTTAPAARALDIENTAKSSETDSAMPAPVNLGLPRSANKSSLSGERKIAETISHCASKTLSSGTVQAKEASMLLGDSGSNLLNDLSPRDPGRMASPGERHPGAVHPVPASGDAFLLLDEARGAPSPSWIHAGTHHAEAGYLDPALGWVRVRADSLANGVHAALIPSSPEAAQVLGSQLAGLNAYLTEHHAEPATVTMAAQGGHGEMGHNLGDQSSARHQNGESNNPGSDGQGVSAFAVRGSGPSRAASPARPPGNKGRLISVMA